MNVGVLIAQVAGIIGWLLLIFSYYKEDINKILLVQIISSIFYCINYYFLGAYSGLIICAFELLKEILYYRSDKDNWIFIMSLPVYLFLAITSFENIFSLLPIIGSVIEGFTLTKSRNVAIIGASVSNFFWVIYDFSIVAYSCAFTDGMLVLSNLSILLLGYSRLLKIDKFHAYKCNCLTRNVSDTIFNLDKNNFGDNYLWDIYYQKEIFEKNKDSLLLLKYKKDTVGYLNYVVIKEKEYDKLVEADNFNNKYDVNSIIKFMKYKKNYMIIDSINVEKKFQNFKTVKLLKKKLVNLIYQKYNLNILINSIICVPVHSFEEEFLKDMGFKIYREYNDGHKLYMLDRKTINELYLTKDYRNKVELNRYKYIKEVNDSILDNIYELDSKFYKDDYMWDKEYQKDIYNKNTNSIIGINYKNKFIGYMNYLCIDENKYNDINNSDVIIDKYEIKDIYKFRKTKKNYININSIVIDYYFQDGIAIKMITKKFKYIIKKLIREGYSIYGINSIAVSKDGRKFLEQLGFIKYKKLDHNNYLYILEGENLKDYLR